MPDKDTIERINRANVKAAAIRIWHARAKHFGEPPMKFVEDDRFELCLTYAKAALNLDKTW